MNRNVLKAILCDYLREKVKLFNTVPLKPCECTYNPLGEFYECKIRIEANAESTVGVIEDDEYYQGHHIHFLYYYPDPAKPITLIARIYEEEEELGI